MSDTIPSVRKVRHDARNAFVQAHEETFGEVSELIQKFFMTLQGRQGMAPAEQEQALRDAAETLTDLPAALAKAAQDPTFNEAVTTIAKQLTDAAEFATDRDFDAHQQAKAEAGETALPSLDGEGFVTVGDTLASELEAVLVDAAASDEQDN